MNMKVQDKPISKERDTKSKDEPKKPEEQPPVKPAAQTATDDSVETSPEATGSIKFGSTSSKPAAQPDNKLLGDAANESGLTDLSKDKNAWHKKMGETYGYTGSGKEFMNSENLRKDMEKGDWKRMGLQAETLPESSMNGANAAFVGGDTLGGRDDRILVNKKLVDDPKEKAKLNEAVTEELYHAMERKIHKGKNGDMQLNEKGEAEFMQQGTGKSFDEGAFGRQLLKTDGSAAAVEALKRNPDVKDNDHGTVRLGNGREVQAEFATPEDVTLDVVDTQPEPGDVSLEVVSSGSDPAAAAIPDPATTAAANEAAAEAIDDIASGGQRSWTGYITPQTDLQTKKPLADVSRAASAAKAVYLQDQLNKTDGSVSFETTGDGTGKERWSTVEDPAGELGIKSTLYDKNSNFQAAIFRNNDDPNKYIVAFKGTNSLADWTHGNIPQGAGANSSTYEFARKLALEVGQSSVPGLGDAEFTGHSLGGGLATYAHILTGNKTHTFNPADLSRNYIAAGVRDSLEDSPYSSLKPKWKDWGAVHGAVDLSMKPGTGLTSVVTENDVLDNHANRLAGGYNDMGDKFIVKTDPKLNPYLNPKLYPVPNIPGVPLPPIVPGPDIFNWGIKAHSMDNMRDGIANQYQTPTWPQQTVPNWGPPKVPGAV